MAEVNEEYPLGTPQDHALICEKHNSMPIDMTCEICEKLICSKCVKEDHKDHNWETITSAATVKRRGLQEVLNKAEKDLITQLDEKVRKVNKQMKENEESCNAEISRSRGHLNTMVKKLNETGKQHEKQLKDNLENKNACLNKVRLSVEEKKETVLHHVKSLKENNGTMTDILFLKTHKDLIKLMSSEDCVEKCGFSLKYDSKDNDEKLLESMMGRIFDSEEIPGTSCKANSFIKLDNLFSINEVYAHSGKILLFFIVIYSFLCLSPEFRDDAFKNHLEYLGIFRYMILYLLFVFGAWCASISFYVYVKILIKIILLFFRYMFS